MLSYVMGFARLVVLTNLLTVDTYGAFQYIQSVYGVLVILVLPGLSIAVSQSVARGFEGALRSASRQRRRWGILAVLGALGVGGYHYLQGETEIAAGMFLVGITLPLIESFNLYTSFLTGRALFKKQAIFGVVAQAFSLIIVVGVVAMTGDLVFLVGAFYLSSLLIGLLFYLRTEKGIPLESSIDPEMGKYARSLSPLQALTAISLAADRILLFQFLGPLEVAVFSVATAMPNRLKGLFRITGALAFPKLATKSAKNIAEILPSKLALMAGGILIVCLIYAFSAPVLFRWFFPQYVNAINLSQVVVFYALIGVSYPIGAFLQSHKRTRELYILHIGVFAARMISLLLLIPIYGIWGAVISSLISAAASIGISLFFLYRERRVRV